MAIFDDEQMIELGKVRERLEAYRVRSYYLSYPDIPPEPQPAKEQEVWQPKQWDRLQQLRSEVLHMHNNLHELQSLLEIKKPSINKKGRFNKYA